VKKWGSLEKTAGEPVLYRDIKIVLQMYSFVESRYTVVFWLLSNIVQYISEWLWSWHRQCHQCERLNGQL